MCSTASWYDEFSVSFFSRICAELRHSETMNIYEKFVGFETTESFDIMSTNLLLITAMPEDVLTETASAINRCSTF